MARPCRIPTDVVALVHELRGQGATHRAIVAVLALRGTPVSLGRVQALAPGSLDVFRRRMRIKPPPPPAPPPVAPDEPTFTLDDDEADDGDEFACATPLSAPTVAALALCTMLEASGSLDVVASALDDAARAVRLMRRGASSGRP